jgi:cold shock CspA family protein
MADLPQEQGVICSLRESFGFIHCADRPEEIFFHYSSVDTRRGLHPDDLRVDMEVDFRVGPSSRDPSKMAAYEVSKLPEGTSIVWETEEGEEGQKFQGIVEKVVRDNDRRGGNSNPGSIRILVAKQEGNEETDKTDKTEETAEKEGNKDAKTEVVAAPEGPLARFSSRDYIYERPPNDPTQNRASALRGNRNDGASRSLSKGDLVECRMVRDRRNKDVWAREIRLLQSEKERAHLEAERELLSNATLEHGVITSLKGDYGFLQSSTRRGQIFFHYSSIHLEEDEEGSKEGKDDLVLKEGQDMQFLVVTETGGDNKNANKNGGGQPQPSLKRRVSARCVKLQPRGSVLFHETIAQGVKGRLSMPPQLVDSTHDLESHGRIQLLDALPDKENEGEERLVEECFLSANDSPGGSFAFRGGSSLGMWVQEGDILLFDLVKDFVDGSCHAKPTRYLTPNPKPLELLMGGTEYPDVKLSNEKDEAVRLIDLALPMRAEGVVNAVRESYGFLHYAERPVDVHFKLFQVIPGAIQTDLRRNMGYPDPEKPLPLQVGTEVSCDLSVHGTIHAGPPNSSAGGRGRGRQAASDRENLKAQRILFLPKGSIKTTHTLATGVEALIAKEETKQSYSGMIELESPVQPMTLAERHPFVARAIDAYVESSQTTPLVFHDVQTQKEDDIIFEMIESRAKGKLTWSYVPQPGETEHEGRLVLKKVEAGAPMESSLHDSEGKSEDSGGDAAKPKKTPKKKQKDKSTKTIHFDKGCLSADLKNDAPPGVGDKVRFDIVQSRRTGVIVVANMTMVERHIPEYTESSEEGIGVVTEVVPRRKFGFLSLQDENASKRELIFFHLSSVVSESTDRRDGLPVRKGDEVKFKIGTEKNGKRVALNITLLPKGSVPSKEDKNAARGIVLLEPSHTSLKNTPLRHASSNASQNSIASQSSRWDKSREKDVTAEPLTEQGCILLVSDPSGMFKPAQDENGSSGISEEQTEPGMMHLRYKNGALAVHGSGSTSVSDEKSYPKRGDLVSFVKAKSGKGVRDIRVVSRAAASLLRGRLEDIKVEEDPNAETGKSGSAKFIAATSGEEIYDVSLSEVVSCDAKLLKEKETVEAIVHESAMYGICRTVDLYLESKLGASHRERPKLNLVVKKDRGGTIIAQSMISKGPDGTNGFATSWTARVSQYTIQDAGADRQDD